MFKLLIEGSVLVYCVTSVLLVVYCKLAGFCKKNTRFEILLRNLQRELLTKKIFKLGTYGSLRIVYRKEWMMVSARRGLGRS